MCGIVGVVARNSVESRRLTGVRTADGKVHCGLDRHGIEFRGEYLLVDARLAMDLSERGRMLMSNADSCAGSQDICP